MPEMKDPVCGMTIEEATAAVAVVYDGTRYYFCSKRCADRFEKDPQGYL